MRRFPVIRQLDQQDCGPTCLRIVARHYGRDLPADVAREKCNVGRAGSSVQSIAGAAEAFGYKALPVRMTFDDLRRDAPLPCIAWWQGRHYVVVYRIEGDRVWVSDPAHGRVRYTHDEFCGGWLPAGQERGAALFMEPSAGLASASPLPARARVDFSLMRRYIQPHKSMFAQLFLGLLVLSGLQLLFPFLTQAVVDQGIAGQNLGFVRLVLIAQLTLSVTRAAGEFIPNPLLVHLRARIHISLVSDFLRKLIPLPPAFFGTRQI